MFPEVKNSLSIWSQLVLKLHVHCEFADHTCSHKAMLQVCLSLVMLLSPKFWSQVSREPSTFTFCFRAFVPSWSFQNLSWNFKSVNSSVFSVPIIFLFSIATCTKGLLRSCVCSCSPHLLLQVLQNNCMKSVFISSLSDATSNHTAVGVLSLPVHWK